MVVGNDLLVRLMATSILFLLALLVYPLLYRLFSGKVAKNKIKRHNQILIHRFTNLIVWTISIFILIGIWNLGFDTLWTTITGMIALVAIGFVAVWSLLSNVIAGFILYFVRSFEIGDIIKILPEEIEGELIAIDTMFIRIRDKNGNIYHVPNNLIFQRVVITVKQN